VLVLGRHLLLVLQRRHPDDLDERAEGDRLDAVLGLSLAERPDGRTEADEIPRDLHAEGARGVHVSGLVDRDGDQNAEREQHNPKRVRHQRPFPTISIARALAHASAACTCSTVSGSPKSGASASTWATVSTIPMNGN